MEGPKTIYVYLVFRDKIELVGRQRRDYWAEILPVKGLLSGSC